MKLFFLVLCVVKISTASRVFVVHGVKTLLALEGDSIDLPCETDTPMAYCGFIHPNGTRYSFSGPTLTVGQCAVHFNASKNDSGEWRCHIGSEGSIGVEIMQRINVRVVEALAAVEKNITAVHGKTVTIVCATTKGLTPLKYCRFEPPSGSPFSINSDVNMTHPILDRYYFPHNKSLDRGDCAVTIRKVKYEDVGTWTCGVGMDDEKAYIDTVELKVEGLYTMSTASATGITFGAIAVVITILGFIVWRKRRFLGSIPAEDEGQELRRLRHGGSPRGSPHVTPRASPHVTPRASPHVTPRASPHVTPSASPHVTPSASPHVTPRASRPVAVVSSHASVVPVINLQSPSERGSSISP